MKKKNTKNNTSFLSQAHREFIDGHSLRDSELIKSHHSAIYWCREAIICIDEVFQGLAVRGELKKEPSSGMIWQLLHRNCEHLESANITIVTKCGSAEVLARSSIEASVNVLYMLAQERDRRCLAFLENFAASEEKEVRSWRASVSSLAGNELDVHNAAIARRQEVTVGFRSLVERLHHEVLPQGEPRLPWPNIYERFAAIEDSIGYRTIYARLCAQTHTDAEETLRYMLAKISGDPDLSQRMASETVYYSRMMVLIAVGYLLDAVSCFADTYGAPAQMRRADEGSALIEQETLALAKLSGSID